MRAWRETFPTSGAVKAHAAERGEACPCGSDGLRDALEHVQRAELALEREGWPVE